MEKMTRAQINERLEKLRKSRLNDESYTIARPAMATGLGRALTTIERSLCSIFIRKDFFDCR